MNIMEEIARLEQELQQRRAQMGERHETFGTKELLHEVVGERIQTAAPMPAAPVFPPAPGPSVLDDVSQGKVQELVGIAFGQSLEEAIRQAVATKNPAIIDAFHASIVDELYDEMVTQKMVPEMSP